MFKSARYKIEIEKNLNTIVFLDITSDLLDGTYKTYDQLLYFIIDQLLYIET